MKVVPQRLRDLQLLVGPVGSERGQEAGAVAVNAEHDVGCMNSHQTAPFGPHCQHER